MPNKLTTYRELRLQLAALKFKHVIKGTPTAGRDLHFRSSDYLGAVLEVAISGISTTVDLDYPAVVELYKHLHDLLQENGCVDVGLGL